MLIICIAQGVDAGILIQQNLYAGNMAGKNKFSLPFVVVRELTHQKKLLSMEISFQCVLPDYLTLAPRVTVCGHEVHTWVGQKYFYTFC